MRKILFRGKTEQGDWVYGDIRTTRNGIAYILPFGDFISIKVIFETVGMYTSLTDKNGTKIFEGDIVKTEEYIGKIVFNENSCDFEFWFNVVGAVYGEKATWKRNLAQIGRFEVIGNIHDNIELIS